MIQPPKYPSTQQKPDPGQDGQNGQNLIEYALVSLLLSLLAVISLRGLGNVIGNALLQIASNLSSAL